MRPMPELKITMAKVADLLPYVGNAKLHPHEQVDQIARSMEEFGNNDPIAVWHNADGEMEIVEGHGRLLALRKLGIKECPTLALDHLSDEQRRMYTHVHNKLNMNSGFDLELLADELEQIGWEGADDYGFDLVAEVEAEDAIEEELSEEVKAKVPFAKYIGEASNYVVLTFHTEKDWLRAQSVLGLETVQSYSTAKKGEVGLFTGIGRVLDGNEAFRKIAEQEKALG